MKIKFVPQNIELDSNPDKTLLQIATENGIEIKSICKGVPSCAECRIRVIDGDSNVLPPTKSELELIGTNWRIDSRRLACQIRCYGDITVDMTEQLERQANQTKKVRGYRSNRQVETQALQDTMILTEKPEFKPEPPSRPEGQEKQQGRQGQPGSGKKSGKGRGGRDGRNEPRTENRNDTRQESRPEQGQNRGPGRGQGRQQGKPQNRGQGSQQGSAQGPHQQKGGGRPQGKNPGGRNEKPGQ